MKRLWVSLIAAGLLIMAAIGPVAGEEAITVNLDEVDDSGVEGQARLVAADDQTEVEVLITAGLDETAVHPVHIHEGTCDDLGDVVYPLEDIEGGVSESEIDAELMDLMDGNHAINVHLSEDEMDVNVACGDIEEAGVGGPAEDDDAVADDDDVAVDDEDDAVADDDDDVVVDDDDDAVADDEDDAVVDDEDDAIVDDEDDAVVDDEDDAVVDDDEDDAVVDDDDAVAEDDDVVMEEDDDIEDEIVPAAGSVGGPSGDTIALFIALMGGSALGFGVLVRRQAGRAMLRR